MIETIKWFYPEEIPTEKNFSTKDFSIDVLIYFQNTNSHAIGWYHFSAKEWFLLSSKENKNYFAWRFLRNDVDKALQKNSENGKWFYPKDIPDE